MIWSVFFSVKYAGNLSLEGFGSKTTLASAWNKSRPNAVSFIENSEIIEFKDDPKSDTSEDIDKEYFSEEEQEEEDIFK